MTIALQLKRKANRTRGKHADTTDEALDDMSWKNIDLASQDRYAKSIFQLICKQVNENESSPYSVIRIYTPSDNRQRERGAKQTLLSVCLHVDIPV